MASIRWGIIGAGDVVARKSGPAIMEREGSTLQHVMRRSEDAARRFAKMYQVPRWSTAPGDVIDDPEVDIVYVATPPSTHAEYVCAAAAGGKHVLVEKPMAMNAAEAETMCTACEEAGVELFVAYYRRFQPHVCHIRKLLEGGHLGGPIQAVIDIAAPTPAAEPGNWRVDPSVSGGGIFVDIGAHRIDVLVSLFGAPTDISGCATPLAGHSGIEALVSLSLQFQNGVVASVAGDFSSGREADRFEVFGTNGCITADPLDGHVFSYFTGGRAHLKTHRNYDAPHYGLIAHIVRVLNGEKKNGASGRDGLETERILDVVRAQVRL